MERRGAERSEKLLHVRLVDEEEERQLFCFFLFVNFSTFFFFFFFFSICSRQKLKPHSLWIQSCFERSLGIKRMRRIEQHDEQRLLIVPSSPFRDA